MAPVLKRLPDRIRDLLERHKMTVRELAVKSDLTERTIYRLLKGDPDPKVSTLEGLAKAFDMTVPELLAQELSVEELTRLLLFLGRAEGRTVGEIAALLQRLDQHVDTAGDRTSALRVAEEKTTYAAEEDAPDEPAN